MRTGNFFDSRQVFSLDEATHVLALPGGRAGTVERLKHHLQTGKLKLVSRGIYAVVPAGINAERFQVDAFLVTAVLRSDSVFSYHSKLELLGTAQSLWKQCTVFTGQRRWPINLDGIKLCFLDHPSPLQKGSDLVLGTQRVERRGRLLITTGPERTLVEGF